MKASDVLDKAADIIIRDGWCQGEYYKSSMSMDDEVDALVKHAPCCQAGAIYRAIWGKAWAATHIVGIPEADRVTLDEASHYMKVHLRVDSPIAWNDAEGRTAGEVIAALRAAAELARRDGK